MGEELPLTPEVLVPRLGDYLVEKRLITLDQLQRALERQSELRASGKIVPVLGQILVEMGYIERAVLDQAITEQIIALRNALQEANNRLEQRVKERTIELEKALQRLSELTTLKSNFVANISHELRTPLTHLKGYLELLAMGDFGALTPKQQQALGVIQKATERLERLIEDLILFSMSERGQVSLQIKPFDIKQALQNIIANTTQKAKNKNIQVTYEFGHDLPPVEADQEMIKWVVDQLLDNAIKFTSNGGYVCLKVVRENGCVSVSVMDTGIGIPAHRIDEIFEPFHQLNGSSTRRYGGTGLGLSLVKNIIESHGSIIRVTSEEGKGSEFTFLLKAFTPQEDI